MLTVTNATIVTMDPERRVITNGYLQVGDDTIKAVGEMQELRETANFLDAKGKILMPGLINLHDHPCASLLRATSRGLSLEDWVGKVALPMIFNLDHDTLAFGSKYQAAEKLLMGTTTVLVHCVNVNDQDSFQAIYEPAAEL